MPPRHETNLGYFLTPNVQRWPDRKALIDAGPDPAEIVTYGELDHRMSRFGACLARRGLSAGDRVLLLVGNCSLFVEAFFGAMRLGAVPVPLNPATALPTLQFILEDCSPRAVVASEVAHQDLLDAAEAHSVPVLLAEAVDRPAWDDVRAAMADDIPDLPEISPAPLDAAIHTYTSGSTGKPKGVILTHGGMIWSVRTTQAIAPVQPQACGLVALPMFHKNAMRGIVKPMLFGGGSIVILPRFEPQSFFRAIAKFRCTHTSGVPAVFNSLNAHRDIAADLDLSSMQTIAVGSAAVTHGLLKHLEGLFPQATIKESYGLTEGGSPFWPRSDGTPTPLGSCGALADGYEVRLVDLETGESGDAGELWMRSPYVLREYHNRSDLNRERIVDGWLRSGDLFVRDAEGFYYFRGRVDDMFNCGGENIYPKEVEDLLLRHEDVAEAVVLPIAHTEKGAAPAAVVRLRPGGQADAESLKRFCLENAPAYLHPRHIAIVDTLPLTQAGKYDRTQLSAILDSSGTLTVL
jgi:long-chain acyl-CoA synthetase